MSVDYVAQLRSRPGTLVLVPEGTTNAWTIRVQVGEAWDVVRMRVAPDTSVAEVKAAALAVLVNDANDADAYEVKYRGELVDEGETLQHAGLKNGSILLVIGRRKRPVR